MFSNLTAVVFAIVMAILMLLMRELILWHGKKNRDYDQAQADAPGASRSETCEDEIAYNDWQSEFEEIGGDLHRPVSAMLRK